MRGRDGILTRGAACFLTGHSDSELTICVPESTPIPLSTWQQWAGGSQDVKVGEEKASGVGYVPSYTSPSLPGASGRGTLPLGCFTKGLSTPPNPTSTFQSTPLVPQPPVLQPRHPEKTESCQVITPKPCCYPHRYLLSVPAELLRTLLRSGHSLGLSVWKGKTQKMTPGRKNEDFKIAWGKQKPHKSKRRECDMHKSTLVLTWLWLSTCLTRDSRRNARAPFFSGIQSLPVVQPKPTCSHSSAPWWDNVCQWTCCSREATLFNHSHRHPKLPYGAIGRKRGLNGNPSSHKYTKICFPKINPWY